LADRQVAEQLAGVRARYAGSGFGNSAREALSEGQAVADVGTKLGDVLAERGIGARAQDLSTALQAFLGAGQQNLLAQQNQLQATNQLGNLGNVIGQIGAMEQSIPNANLLATILGLYTRGSGTSQTSQQQQTQSGFLGM